MQIGITRDMDPSQDLTVFYRLKDINVIITKDLRNVVFQNLLLENKEKIILHVNCTGWGTTPIEPKIPHLITTQANVRHLINSGFPSKQIVLRIDPIIPNEIGFKALILVLDAFMYLRIQRCKLSLLRLYPFIQQRFGFLEISQTMGCPYWSDIDGKIFQTPSKMHINKLFELIEEYKNVYDFEYCNFTQPEKNDYSTGCVSNKDLEIMGYNDIIINPARLINSKCNCPINVIELMQERKQCINHCLFCSRPTKKI